MSEWTNIQTAGRAAGGRLAKRYGLITRLRSYWALIKDLQTGLLVITAAAGYASGCCTNMEAGGMFAMLASLFLAVSGSTALNMVYDRDIDALMRRTAGRPLSAGKIGDIEALLFGLAMAAGGVAWSFYQSPAFGGVVAAGVFLNVVVYTLWLKRRTPYSIILGGLAGGMPVLAGRTLATGRVDLIGVLLVLAILCWIPTHIMTFNIKHQADYRQAGVPNFPETYGVRITRRIIIAATLLAVGLVVLTSKLIGLTGFYAALVNILGASLIGLALLSALRPKAWLNFLLYKGASVYMLGSMVFLILGGL